MSHAITTVIHPVHVEISDILKSHTDATSNCKMKENFLQDFPGEKVHLIYVVLICMAYLYNKFYVL